MFNSVCRVGEYLKFHRVLTVCIGLACFLLTGFIWAYDASLQTALCDVAPGNLPDIDAVNFCQNIWDVGTTLPALLLGVFLTIATTAAPQRKAVIHALLDGYINNFLRHVIGEDGIPMIIVKPGHEIVKEGGVTGIRLAPERDWIDSLEKDHGFKIEDEMIGNQNRMVHVVTHPEFPGTRIGIDFSRNLSSLRDTVKAESQSRFDRILCSEEGKYIYIRDMYFRAMAEELGNLAAGKRPRIVSGAQTTDVADELKAALAG